MSETPFPLQLPFTGRWLVQNSPVGECGNSGNSTEPHLHIQVSDSIDRDGRGIPLVFVRADGARSVPRTGDIVAA